MVLLLAGLFAATSTTGRAAASPGSVTPGRVGPWRLIGISRRLSFTSDQGLTSLQTTDGRHLVYRGDLSVPLWQRIEGWDHVGDPDSWRGYVVDPFEGNSHSRAKMFLLTTPNGSRWQYVHPLEAGEKFNNPFVAVTPDGQWMVSGEWGTMTRLLVFPTPILNRAAPPPTAPLRLATTIRLDRRLRDLQGCDFVSSIRLVCASNDPLTDLWPSPRQLLQVELAAPLRGQPVSAHVTYLGPLPQISDCHGTFETEGVDYDTATDTLRVEMIPPSPCNFFTTVYAYRL